MKISLRGWLLLGCCAATLVALAIYGPSLVEAAGPAPAKQGQLTEETLGTMLEAIGLKPKKAEKRYDFAFRSKLEKQEWELSMSAVLSHNGEAVWLIAWLDELPKSAADVPRSALLRMLADNDRLGNGKFFAYVPENRRFVLQKVIPNQNIQSAELRSMLLELGESVIHTHPHWAVANWNADANADAEPNAPSGNSPARTASGTSQPSPSTRR